jgi:prophage tail gpP-like protein
LSTIYNVTQGDTFEIISRKQYGTEEEAFRIASSNPGVFEPLTPGTVLIIPPTPSSPTNIQQNVDSSNESEVAITIDGTRFRFWNEVRITRSIDSMDTVEFIAPFDSTLPGFKNIFRPFSYKTVIVTVGGVALFTGTMVAVNPVIENTSKTITVSGYSLPGVLNDCTAPNGTTPLEYNDVGLTDIATALTAPFGISVEFDDNQGAIFERVSCEPSRKILDFLIALAKQRNLIISSSPEGKLQFIRSKDSGVPVARLRQGESPILSVTPFFSPQEYYSHITGIEPVIVGLKGSQFTVKNSRLLGVVRPLTFNVNDTKNADVKSVVEAKAGRMFGNMVSYLVRVDTWRDPNGVLWKPNTFVTLIAPDAMIYSEYAFIIRSVEFNRDSKSEVASLNIVIPGAFSGQTPEALPWDD